MEANYFTGAGTKLKTAFEVTGPGVLEALLAREGTRMSDYRRVFVHQVTVPYAQRFCELTGVAAEQLVWTVPELGNVASASLPIQLARTWEEFEPGDKALLVGLGGGISIAAVQWTR